VSGFLVDVNLLIAMAWPTHTAHDRARRWFVKSSRIGWATCPFIQSGFVRIVSNPAFSPDALTPRDALALLSANLEHPSHRFYSDDISLLEAVKNTGAKLLGHGQITDAYLLGLARHHKLKLATLDTHLRWLSEDAPTSTEIIQ
jgi:Predicted nucleic acid-binding protein, contains PIN domain